MTAVIALVAAMWLTQQPRTDIKAASASIKGRVTDASSGAPVSGAIVTLLGSGDRPAQVFTDADGRYEMAGLVPQTYALIVTAGEFRATHARYDTLLDGARQLRPGEARAFDIAMTRALVISGRVVDEAGLPLARVRVHVRSVAGRYVQAGNTDPQTDDRGRYRLYGLPPGRYVVCADPKDGPMSATGRQPRFVKTCYPSNENESAQPVTVEQTDVEGIDIHLARRSTYTISGSVVDSSGHPASPTVLTLTKVQARGSEGSSQRTPGSHFTISDVVPGRYVVSAQVGEHAPSSAPAAFGAIPLDVNGEDVAGIVVVMRAGGRARGRITFEDGGAGDLNAAKLRVEAASVNRPGLSYPALPSAVAQDFTFELKDVHGPHLIRVSGLPPGLTVRSITYRGRDIRDLPAELDGDPRTDALEVTVTRRGAELSGRVLGDRGSPADAGVYVFPADRRRWEGWFRGSTRTIASEFRVQDLPEGDYYVVAVPFGQEDAAITPNSFDLHPYARLATIAERVNLTDNDRRVMDLRVAAIPEEWKR